jgi:transposase
MARKSYSPEFRRQAVDLYKSTPGATLRGISADLGVSRHTLNDWVHADDLPAIAPAAVPVSGGAGAGPRRAGRPQALSGPDAEIAALRARVAALETERAELVAEQTKLVTEREILRRAAKYFAGETNW